MKAIEQKKAYQSTLLNCAKNIKNVQKLQTLEKEKNNLWQDCRVIQGHLSDTISKCKDQTKEALEQFMQEYLLYTSAKEELLENVENYCAKIASNQKSGLSQFTVGSKETTRLVQRFLNVVFRKIKRSLF